ncbi:MAG: sigma-54-dependent Fis family transcriptional regulator [Nitrospirae bacterium]|nr:MAG: sigma-54-dependent Fis family transcriptional regulator [Nitrospirota bacterium]
MGLKILVAEDEAITLKHIVYSLRKEGHTVTGVGSGTEAAELISEGSFDIVITDIKMPGLDGLSLLALIKERVPETDVVMITGFGSIESAVEAMKKGAAEYITKPFNLDELILKISRLEEKKRLEKENRAFKISLGLDQKYPFIAKSRMMKRVVEVIGSITNSDCNVLLTGESGVGKGLVAKLIHYTGARKDRPFIGLNCAVFTEDLLASELFGHEKGAFTGALAAKKGLVEIADTGTLFLDEIAEMSPSLQAKLLKAIEDREFIRVGGTRAIRVDIRLIAATNQNLAGMIKEGKFREDLYYRLNVMDIFIPPLRERRGDIVPLCGHFLAKYTKKENKKITGFAKETMDILQSYGFPGNVRELENIIERAVILERSALIQPGSLPQSIKLFEVETIDPNRVKTIDELNREYAERILDFVDHNRSKAAELLGISRTSLWRILKRQD